MELNLFELQYLLSRFPDISDDERVCLLMQKIERRIDEELRLLSDESLNWFKDPVNQHTAIKEFLDLPYNIRSMSCKDFFFSYDKPTYKRWGNNLTRRGFVVVENLLELTVYQFNCLRGVGESGQKAILGALLEHSSHADHQSTISP